MIDVVVEMGNDAGAWTAVDPRWLEAVGRRLCHGRALTTTGLEALEEMLLESGAGSRNDVELVTASDLTGFLRPLVALDPQAVREAFAEFISDSTLNTCQLELLNVRIAQLTRGGSMDPEALYEPPYTEIAPQGLEDLFAVDTVDHFLALVHRFGDPDVPASKGFVEETAELGRFDRPVERHASEEAVGGLVCKGQPVQDNDGIPVAPRLLCSTTWILCLDRGDRIGLSRSGGPRCPDI